MNLDESQKIYATISPMNAMDYYSIMWASEDTNVVHVISGIDGSATLYAMGIGETNIVVTIGDKKTKCHVIVQ